MRAILFSLMVAGLGLTGFGCSKDPVAVCKEACSKLGGCIGSTQGQILDCQNKCANDPEFSGKNCANIGEIDNCLDKCQSSSCNDYVKCADGCPNCVK